MHTVFHVPCGRERVPLLGGDRLAIEFGLQGLAVHDNFADCVGAARQYSIDDPCGTVQVIGWAESNRQPIGRKTQFPCGPA
jgi:hypothetical protein